MRKLLSITFFLFVFSYLQAQEEALVFFADKPNVAMSIANPTSILSQEAVARKALQGIAIDARDVPVDENYKSQINNAPGIVVMAKSKWLNAVYVRGSKADIDNLLNFSFVTDIEFMNKSLNRLFSQRFPKDKFEMETIQNITYDYGAAQNQVEMINADKLHSANYNGDGITVAFLDNGYPNVLTNPAYDHVRNEGRLLGYYDFVERTPTPYGTGNHGALTFSDAAAIVSDANPSASFTGTAPKASYYLFVTEDSYSEGPVEEAYWVEAMERADSLGVYVTNTSLGYQAFDKSAYDHSYSDLDGQTTLAARGANHAFDKGMINVISAGNEGYPWDFGYISTPADAMGALTVGAVDAGGSYVGFSSHGPTYDGRIKPDIMAQGYNAAVVDQFGNVTHSNGTSFSSPITAGAVASLWQVAPKLKNSVVMQVIKESASQYTTPDNTMGYGIPDFGMAMNKLIQLDTEQQVRQTLFSVYPNPVQSDLNISFPKDIATAVLVLYDVLGNPVLQKKLTPSKNRIDVSGLSSGMYIASLTSNDKTTSFKIIKE